MGTHVDSPLPRPPATHRPPVRSRRGLLLDAMTRVVNEEGYHGTTVSKVVAAAGVSRNAFYEHFPNKEACFLAAYDAIVEDAVAHVRAAAEGADGWERRLEAGLAAFLQYAADEPERAGLCIVEALAAGPRALARRDAAMRSFARVVERCRAEQDDAGVPSLQTAVVAGGIYEIVYARLLGGRTATLPELLPDLMYVWLAPFAGPELAGAARADVAGRVPTRRVQTLAAAAGDGQDTDVF